MKVSEKLKEALNEQYNFELESGYEYLAMAADLSDKGWDGFSHFMIEQAKEEYEHAEKFYHFLVDVEKKPVLNGMQKPKADFKDVLEIFKAALAHEEEVTKRIENLYEMSLKEKAYCVSEFLNWYLREQVEEETNMKGIIETLEGVENSYSGLYLFDKELGKR